MFDSLCYWSGSVLSNDTRCCAKIKTTRTTQRREGTFKTGAHSQVLSVFIFYIVRSKLGLTISKQVAYFERCFAFFIEILVKNLNFLWFLTNCFENKIGSLEGLAKNRCQFCISWRTVRSFTFLRFLDKIGFFPATGGGAYKDWPEDRPEIIFFAKVDRPENFGGRWLVEPHKT